MLAGAVLLSGYQLIKDVKAAKATPEEIRVEEEKTLAQMEQALGDQDMDEVLAAVAMKKQLDEKSQYVKNSELMQINPYEEDVVYLQYSVVGDSADIDYADFFEQHILSGSNASELVEPVSEGLMTYVGNDGTLITEGSKTGDNKNGFVVLVRGLSAEDCSTRAADVKADLDEYAKTLVESLSGISLTLVEETQTVIVDSDLVSLQNQTAASAKLLNNNLDSLKSNMTGDQLALYVEYTENAAEDTAQADTTQEDGAQEDTAQTEERAEGTVTVQSASVHFSLLKFVLGAVIGLVLAVVYILLAFACSAKLRSEEEVKNLYRTSVLGTIRSGKTNAIDRLILKWRYHRAGTLTLKEEVDLIAANIRVACKDDSRAVYLTGSDMTAVSQELLTQIAATCKEKGVSVVLGSEISYHADALEAMAEVGQVVFVEQLRGAYYDEIYKEISTCMEHKIQVLGMVVTGA
jgi:hypothetical protein